MAQTNELYHYGVSGMKWGVRKYQNPDGTLTELGKKRYNQYQDANRKAIAIGIVKPGSSREAVASAKAYHKYKKMVAAQKKIDIDAYRESILGEEKNKEFKLDQRKLQEASDKLEKKMKQWEKMVHSNKLSDTQYMALIDNDPEFKRASTKMESYFREFGSLPYRELLYAYTD